jgi:hypothetical protein
MAKFEIRKAEKRLRKLRLALIGVSKSGKTLTALKFARALAGPDGKVGLIDTEGGNSEIYAGEPGVGEFGIIALESFSPATYIEAAHALVEAGCDVLVIDSLSHAWIGKDGVLEIVDSAGGSSKFTNGWGKATPLHNDLITSINHCPVHIIATMRQKADYILETNAAGKQVPKKVGMAAVQREGMEYEFDVTATMHDAAMTIDGIRGTALEGFMGKTIKKPDAKFIDEIRGLVDNNKPAPAPVAPPPADPPKSDARPIKIKLVDAISKWSKFPSNSQTPEGKGEFAKACSDAIRWHNPAWKPPLDDTQAALVLGAVNKAIEGELDFFKEVANVGQPVAAV